VGELDPVFQIDPLPAWLRTTRPPSHPVYSMGLSECCSNTFWRAGSFKPHRPPLRLSRSMITFDAALPTSKLEAVEYDLGPTCCAIETSACAQMRTNIPLGVLALPESHHK